MRTIYCASAELQQSIVPSYETSQNQGHSSIMMSSRGGAERNVNVSNYTPAIGMTLRGRPESKKRIDLSAIFSTPVDYRGSWLQFLSNYLPLNQLIYSKGLNKIADKVVERYLKIVYEKLRL